MPHVCARFGPGGQLIRVIPNLPSEGQPALVEVHSMEVRRRAAGPRHRASNVVRMFLPWTLAGGDFMSVWLCVFYLCWRF